MKLEIDDPSKAIAYLLERCAEKDVLIVNLEKELGRLVNVETDNGRLVSQQHALRAELDNMREMYHQQVSGASRS